MYRLIRYSLRKPEDDEVVDFRERDYQDENILMIDDIIDESVARDALEDYLDQRGAENVVFSVGIPE
jgi:hypothetical protein